MEDREFYTTCSPGELHEMGRLVSYFFLISFNFLAPSTTHGELYSAPVYVYEIYDETGSRRDNEFKLHRFSFFPKSQLGRDQESGEYCALETITFTVPRSFCGVDSEVGGIYVKAQSYENDGLLPRLECSAQWIDSKQYALKVRVVSTKRDEAGELSGDIHNLTVQRTKLGSWGVAKYTGSFLTPGVNEWHSAAGTIVAFDKKELQRDGGIALECRGEKSWFWVDTDYLDSGFPP